MKKTTKSWTQELMCASVIKQQRSTYQGLVSHNFSLGLLVSNFDESIRNNFAVLKSHQARNFQELILFTAFWGNRAVCIFHPWHSWKLFVESWCGFHGRKVSFGAAQLCMQHQYLLVAVLLLRTAEQKFDIEFTWYFSKLSGRLNFV